MTDYMDTLPYLLYGRVVGPAVAAMQRAPQAEDSGSAWTHPSTGDTWLPAYVSDSVLSYTRSHSPGAVIRFENLQPSNLADTKWDPPVKAGETDVERFAVHASVPAGQTTKVAFGRRFSDVKTLEEEATVSAKLSFEAHVGYAPANTTGGVSGGVKFGVEATAGYRKKWHGGTTEDKTVNLEIPVVGPFIGSVIASRSKTSLQTRATLVPTFEGQVVITDNGAEIYRWNTYADLLAVLAGNAPLDRALAGAFTFDPLTQTGGGISEARIKSFNARRLPEVSWPVVYDDVSDIDISFRPDGDAMGDNEPAPQEPKMPGINVMPYIPLAPARPTKAERKRRKRERRERRLQEERGDG